MLREVWSLADNHKTGKLDRTQFFFAIRMITILCSPIYAGSKPTIDLYNSSIHKRIPLPIQLNKKPEEEKKVVEEVKVVEPVQAAPTPVQPTPVQPAPSNLPLPTQAPPNTQHHAPYPQPPVNTYSYGYPSNVPPAHLSGYGYAGYAQPHVPAPAAIPPAQAGYYNAGYAYPVQQVTAAPPAAAPAPQPVEDEEFSDFAGAVSNPQNHPLTNNIPQPQLHHQQTIQHFGVSPISAPQRAQPPASLIDDDLLLLGPADIIEKTQSMSISSSIPDSLPNQASLSKVNNVNDEEDDGFSDFTGAHSSSVPTHVPAPVTQSLATKSASPVPLFDESAPTKHQDRDLLQKALSTSNEDDDDFTSFTGSTVTTNPTPLAPPTSTVVPPITSTAPSTVSTAPKLYDASKLSIFDDMVENDLMATKHEEDWEDFSGATSNSNQVPPSTELPAHTLTSSTHLAGQLGPITVDIAAQSVNPFDDFDGFEASDTNQKLQSSISDVNNSNKDQDKEEEDFGDFETHAIPLQRADSIHRSDEVVDLPAYYQHSKHQRHESGSTRTFPSDEGVSSKFGSSVGSEISFKQGALFIEDTLHRSGEIVDFQAFQAPEPVLIRRGSKASTHDGNDEVEDEVVQGPINYHQQMNSRQSNNNLQMYDSGKTFISDASIVDIRSDIGCDSVSEYNSGKYIAGGDSSSEYNSGKFDLSRMNSTQSLARDILNDDNDEDAEEEYNKRNVPKSVGPSEKTVVKTVAKLEEDDDDPFADLEIDETAQKEYALNNPLPVEEVSPSTNDMQLNRTSPLSLHISTTAPTSQPQTFDFGDDEDDIGEFQDFQSVPNSPMPSHSTSSHVASSVAPAMSSNYDIADLLDFSSDVAPSSSTAPNSSSTIKPVSSVNDTFDLLSLDYVPATSATLAPSNNLTSHTVDPFDPFSSAPSTTLKSEESSSFEANFDNHTTQHNHQEEEFDPFTDYQSSAVTNNTDNDDNDDDFTTFADHTSSSTPVAASVAPVQQIAPPSVAPVQEKKKEEKPIVVSTTPTTTSATIPTSDKPLTLQNLEVLAVLLFEQNYYEAAYHCTLQSTTLRQINDLSEQKKVALENDELEVAVLVKKQIKEITKQLVSSDIEQQWQRLVSSSPSSTKPLSIQEYYQRLSKDKGITKILLQKIQQTYYQPTLIPDKHSPLQDQLKYYLSTKHAIKIIDYLISQQSYDIYEKIYNELLQLCKAKIITIQQYIQQYQQINKNIIQNEIKGHSFMQSFVLQSTVLLEHTVYLAVAAVELLFFERSVNNGSSQKKKGIGNLALEVFDLSQEILVQMEGSFEVKSDVSRKSIDEIVLANATVSQNLPQEKVMHCHLIFRPLAKQIEGNLCIYAEWL